MEKEYKFSLQLINEILSLLGEQKAKDVYETIAKIHQVVAQQSLVKEE